MGRPIKQENETGLFFEGQKIMVGGEGYPRVQIDKRQWFLHLLIWERAHGPRPKGMHVHHKDQNVMNYALSNLELLTPEEHRRIHAGWIREGGIWIKKPCYRCKQILTLDNFHTHLNKKQVRVPVPLCKPCSSIVVTERNRRIKATSPEKYERKKMLQREARLRRFGVQGQKKDFCVRGHAKTGENLFVTPTGRHMCVVCLDVLRLRNSSLKNVPCPDRIKKFCKHGHSLDDAILRPLATGGVQRNCRTCQNNRNVARSNKKYVALSEGS